MVHLAYRQSSDRQRRFEGRVMEQGTAEQILYDTTSEHQLLRLSSPSYRKLIQTQMKRTRLLCRILPPLPKHCCLSLTWCPWFNSGPRSVARILSKITSLLMRTARSAGLVSRRTTRIRGYTIPRFTHKNRQILDHTATGWPIPAPPHATGDLSTVRFQQSSYDRFYLSVRCLSHCLGPDTTHWMVH